MDNIVPIVTWVYPDLLRACEWSLFRGDACPNFQSDLFTTLDTPEFSLSTSAIRSGTETVRFFHQLKVSPYVQRAWMCS